LTSAAFDVVVVGAGAAGCVVASRLAGAGTRSVALIEAGSDLRKALPSELSDGWHITRTYDWAIKSEPDADGNVRNMRRARLFGGTSWLTRFAVRGSPADFGEWQALGNRDWGFDDVLPYFRRLENDLDFGDRPWHGDRGPMPVTRYPEVDRTEIHAATAAACESVGFASVDDHNRPGAVGVGRMPMSSRAGIRTTTASAYLPPQATAANLTIWTDQQVAAVVLDGNRATGVRLLDGTVVEASVVVLCSGVYGSPAILLHSGIGPADHLRSVGIPVAVDLPGVGQNLSDHPGFEVITAYHGPARSAPLLHTIATFHSRNAKTDGAPDLMLWTADPAPPDEEAQFSIEVVLLKPRSRGVVSLRSADPADLPRVDLRQFTERADLERLVEGYRRAIDVLHAPALETFWTGRVPAAIADEGELRATIRGDGYSIPHVVGTCAMGPAPEAGAVVDSAGGVHGTAGLFVVDASIMPTVPSGFTHLPTIAIAERLSEQIARMT
jgi:choline dehydrogenase